MKNNYKRNFIFKVKIFIFIFPAKTRMGGKRPQEVWKTN